MDQFPYVNSIYFKLMNIIIFGSVSTFVCVCIYIYVCVCVYVYIYIYIILYYITERTRDALSYLWWLLNW